MGVFCGGEELDGVCEAGENKHKGCWREGSSSVEKFGNSPESHDDLIVGSEIGV
jgi:hypothetical protein